MMSLHLSPVTNTYGFYRLEPVTHDSARLKLDVSHTRHRWSYRLGARKFHSLWQFHLKYLPLAITCEARDGDYTTRYVTGKYR